MAGNNPIQPTLVLLDRMDELEAYDPLYAFALDELLCRRAGKGGPAICHIWRHPQAFILGTRDSKLPYVEEALQWLASRGWPAAVRNSGGAAVPLDSGVVNLSLILPNAGMLHEGYRNDFEDMYLLIREALIHTGELVQKGLVEGAYCPGDYDLSIDGFKFCGIAQRRQAHATIIQAFIVAAGSGRARAELVRGFYNIASGGDDTLGHPLVAADSMASLEELAGLGTQAAHVFAQAVKGVLGDRLLLPQEAGPLAWPEPAEIAAAIASLRNRYKDGQR